MLGSVEELERPRMGGPPLRPFTDSILDRPLYKQSQDSLRQSKEPYEYA